MLHVLTLAFIFFTAHANQIKPRLVQIPGGELKPFWIAPTDITGEQEKIRIPPFHAMNLPVTNSEYVDFVRANPKWRKSKIKRIFADPSYLEQFASDLRLKKEIHPRAPVTYVSWFAARAYCESHGLRLPSLAEWEYLGAASETKADASEDPDYLARLIEWYNKPPGSGPVPPVGRGKPNYYGLYDLHGLIWEWIEDFNSSLISGESRTNGSIERELVCAAGSLAGGNKENYPAFMRFAFRSSLKGTSTIRNLGFRCVKGERNE